MSSSQRLQTLIRPEIRALRAYHVPPARGLIKLDAMENPYGWPADLARDWLEVLRAAPLNRYPDAAATELKARLRHVMGIPAEADLLLGNGSDELIQIVMLAVAGPGRVVLAPEPTFVMYRMIACYAGLDYVGVPLRATDFGLDLDAMLEAIERYQPALVFLAYPNNPTGNRFDVDAVRRIIAAAPGWVVVDEAYFVFAEHNFLPSLAEFDNLLLMRTVSKLGLAGLRLGFLVGPPAWLAQFDKVRLPYNINVLTQLSVDFALGQWSMLLDQAERIRADRADLERALNTLPGVTAFRSEANFILFRVGPGQATRVFTALREAGVLIKDVSGSGGLLHDCLRVTVGTPAENEAFLTALAATL